MDDGLDEIRATIKNQELDLIEYLVTKGVLGEELPIAEGYRHWPVLKPNDLPLRIESTYYDTGEMRFYLD